MEPFADDSNHRLDFFMPLDYFWLRDQRQMPALKFIPEEQLPEPYRHLLAHRSDMTPRLRAFHQADILLEVVAADFAPQFVMRLVVLRRSDTMAPVEIGAIAIQLEHFDEPTRELIRSGAAPLGSILESRDIPHTSDPKAYFEITLDARLAQLLGEQPGALRYGRCNALTHHGGIVFADIVEILPGITT